MRGSRRYPTPRGKGSCRGPDKLETLIGESGSIGAPPTIVHAVLDALAPFDIDNLDVPMMPLKVWTAIRGAARQACNRRTAQATSSRKDRAAQASLGFLTTRPARRMSAFAGQPENIYSRRALPGLARNGPPAMSDPSPLSGVERKLDFGAVRSPLNPFRTTHPNSSSGACPQSLVEEFAAL